MPRANRIRVLIADDHATFLAGLSALIGLQPDMIVVGQASDGREAVARWREQRPDVTLLDLRMPFLDGVEAVQQIRLEDPAAGVVLLTTYDSLSDLGRARNAGAKGYLLKDVRREELLEGIREVSRGGTCYPTPSGVRPQD